MKDLTNNKIAIFVSGIVIGMAVFYPSYQYERAQVEVLQGNIKEKDTAIRNLLEEVRTDALAREKAISTQRDYFVEMIRAEFIRVTAAKPAPPEIRYIRRDNDKHP